MAITKLLRIKESGGADKASHLKKNIFYICQDAKTSDGVWIGSNAGSTPGMICRTMVENKKMWGKEDGSQGFHYVLSFPPDSNVDEELAFQFAEDFCRELLHDDFYYVIAVHNDRSHMHVHITFDSVSKTDGMKFHSPKGDWEKRIQPITDRLCEKYHLPVLEYNEDRRGKNYGEWQHSRDSEKGKSAYFTWADIIRDDIDEAIHYSENYEGMLSYLRDHGYKVTRNVTFLSLLPEGAGRAFRTGRLGDGYAKDEIIQRIADKVHEPEIKYRYKTYGDRAVLREIIYAKIVCTPGWKMTPFQRQFWKRWNNTYFIRKPQSMSQEERLQRRQDILEINKLSAAISYMLEHDIDSVSKLSAKMESLHSERDAIKRRLSVCQTKYYKKQPFYYVGQCEKLKKEYQKNPSQDLEDRIQEFTRKVEETCPYEEAYENRMNVKKEMDEYRRILKDIKREIKIAEDVSRLYSQMEAPVRMKDQDISEDIYAGKRLSSKEENKMAGSKPEQDQRKKIKTTGKEMDDERRTDSKGIRD
ncbi:MAG: relaxase/mobilization nuclease domain-containing protein [Clostridiales bacterium]|nr:relaxase/mobilization nuclease domain-containing protein [Clostridiales bacterium]